MPYRARNVRRSRSVDYVMPFLIIISIGIVLVLIFNLWRAIFNPAVTKAAYMHLVSGTAQMKAWGTEDFFDLSSDSLVMQGDVFRTSAGAKVIVEFFDGTLMRVDGGSELGVETVDDDDKNPTIQLNLFDGKLWFNKVYKNTENTDISVKMANVEVDSNLAGVYELERARDHETVRVFSVFDNDGVAVDVLSQDGKSVVETENIGIGQEIVFDKQVLNKYWLHQRPAVLSGIADEFKETAWYRWNFEEDREPTVFEKTASQEGLGLIKVEPEVMEPELEDEEDEVSDATGDVEDVDVGEGVGSESGSESAVTDLGTMTQATITSVAGGTQTDASGFYRVTGNPATITGGISGAAKVVVNGYTLQRFNPGDTAWTYYANADYGLMQAGENFYEVYGLDAAGNKSEVLTVKVYYAPPVEEGAQTGDGADGAVDGAGTGTDTGGIEAGTVETETD